MDITFHQLKVLNEVALQQSVTKASLALNMTQPAVSNIIRLIEARLGLPVIEVLRKQVYITQTGKLLVELYKDISTQFENTQSHIDLMKGNTLGTIRIAAVSTAKYFVPRLLGAFKALYPQIHIELKIKNRAEVIDRLTSNMDDFVIMSQTPNDIHIEAQDFYEDELVVAANVAHPLAKQKKLTLDKLAKEPWLIREQGSGTRIAMENIFSRHQIDPKIEMEIDNNESIKQAIIGNIGISIVSHQSIMIEQRAGYITVLPVQSFPIKHKWYLVKNKGKKLSSIAERFYEYVCTHPNLDLFTSVNER